MAATEIWCDTRQQDGKHWHVDDWFARHGVPFSYRKLDFGDYMTDHSNVSIDTKKDVQELAGNLGREHDRFARECDRARDAGYRLIVLVEELEAYNDRENVKKWTSFVCRTCRKCNPHKSKSCRARRGKPVNGEQIAKAMTTFEKDHGVRFMFCRRGDTARRICELLGVEVKE